jgi:phosphohistidine phosphatase
MVSVLVMRHGEAESPGRGDDAERALTPRGIETLTLAARGAKTLGLAIAQIYCSPLLRTRQTAEICQRGLGGPIDVLEVLRPGGAPEEVATAVETWATDPQAPAERRTQSILLVGHMPDVSHVVGYYVAADAPGIVAFAPGSLACVEFPGRPRAAAGALRWVLTVEQLGRLGIGEASGAAT